MKIDRMFSIENLDDPRKIDWLKQEAGFFLKIMETRTGDVPAERCAPVLSPAGLEQFFRHKSAPRRSARSCSTCCRSCPISRRLRDQRRAGRPGRTVPRIHPLRNRPAAGRGRQKRRLPGNQPQEPVPRRQCLGLPGADHRHEPGAQGPRRQGRGDPTAAIANLCRVLEQLCLFWFEIRRHDIRRTRRSDIYLYMLARLVEHRCRDGQKS